MLCVKCDFQTLKVTLIPQLLGLHVRGLECIAFILKCMSFPSLSCYLSSALIKRYQQAGRHYGTDKTCQAFALLQ